MDKTLSELKSTIVSLIDEYERCVVGIAARPYDELADREAVVLKTIIKDLQSVISVMEKQNG